MSPSDKSLVERGAHKMLVWILEALIIVGVITIPMVFKVKGDLWGRFVTAFWGLIVVAVMATAMVASLKFTWGRRQER